MGWCEEHRNKTTHCWEVAQREDAEQTGLAASSVANDHEFPVSQSSLVSVVESRG